jgi:hypothetical protein
MEKFRGQIKISFQFSEHVGPRFIAAGLTMRLEYADDYKFVSNAVWESDDYTEAVDRGVLDGLIESKIDPELGIHVTLLQINFDPIDSSWMSFYAAAKSVVLSRVAISETRKPKGN